MQLRRTTALLPAIVSIVAVLAATLPARAGSTEHDPKVVAYYFHGNFRCATCRTIEAYSREAVTTGFAEQLETGELAFKVVNTDEPGNAHFVKDFQLVTKSLVLVEYRDGRVVRWKNLPAIWKLVRDREAFLRYVQDETRTFIGEG